MSTEASFRRYFYRAPYGHNNGNLYAASATLFYSLPYNMTVYGGAEYSRKSSENAVDSYRVYGARFGIGKSFGQWLNVNLGASTRLREYDGESAFWGKRKDRETSWSVYLKSPKIQIFGIAPVFTFKNTLNRSSANTYFSYRRREYALKLEKTF